MFRHGAGWLAMGAILLGFGQLGAQSFHDPEGTGDGGGRLSARKCADRRDEPGHRRASRSSHGKGWPVHGEGSSGGWAL